MGNQQINTQIHSQIAQLTLVKKFPHYSILQAPDQTEYIKFLYAPVSDQTDINRHKTKKISLFDPKYLQYRYHQQQNLSNLKALPKIWAFGEDPQTDSLISCTRNKLNFVIFQHPTLSLKLQVQKRIAMNNTFRQSELLALIKSVVNSLSGLYDHMINWNPQNSHKNTFLVTEENIFINGQGQFILSDIIGYLNEIQHIAKHQITLKKQSRSSSMSNLHAKPSNKKIKMNYFQSNLQNLASIIEGIILKFSSFNQVCKVTQQSSSLSTALSTYRSATKGNPCFSLDFELLLKDLKQQHQNPQLIVEKAEKLLYAIHLPTPIERSSEIFFKNDTNEEIISIDKQIQIQKLSQAFNFSNPQDQSSIQVFKDQKQNILKLKLDSLHLQKLRSDQQSAKNQIDPRFMNIKTDLSLPFTKIELNECKQGQRKNTKIRLSLKKCEQITNQTERKKNVSSGKQVTNIEQKNLQFSFKNKQNQKQFKGKQNHISILKNKQNQQPKFKKNTNRSSCQNAIPVDSIMKLKLMNFNNNVISRNSQKRTLVLKKQSTQQEIIKRKPLQILSQVQTTSHMNPMSRKKTLKIVNRQQSHKNLDNNDEKAYKTNLKTEDLGVQGIDNLSSIVSNQNNTMSSYGIPTTEEFKTEDSMIEIEGCIEFNYNDDLYVLIEEKLSSEISNEGSHQVKKPLIKSSTSFVKLSAYQSSIEQSMMQSHCQERIPEFLKQYKLPQKNLLTLNNIILKQKDVIVEESFQQSEKNSIRNSYPNVLSFEYA